MNYLRLLSVLIASLHTGVASAGLILDVTEVGGDVHMSASGTLDVTSLARGSDFTIRGFADPNSAWLSVGPNSWTASDGYLIPKGATFFGPGSITFADLSAGDLFSIQGELNATQSTIYVPDFYVSGSQLSGSSTFLNETFLTLGLIEGTHSYSWGSGSNADSITVNIGTTAVPEPSSFLFVSTAGLALFIRRRSTGRRTIA